LLRSVNRYGILTYEREALYQPTFSDDTIAVLGEVMNLVVWLPAMFLLGLATMGLLFAFVAACQRV